MRFSTIITAYNQHDLTAIHVRECMRSSVIPDEIIVVNDGGKPDLKEKLLALDINTRLIYARIDQDIEWNYTGARNLGVWLSKGQYLIMEDSDNIPTKDAYKHILETADEYIDVDRFLFGRRHKVYLEDVLNKPPEQWKVHGNRVPHQDTQLLRREVYFKLKGCDERFAGRYAWACADWRRRINAGGFDTRGVKNAPYYTVVDGETKHCICEKSETEGVVQRCIKCGLMLRRKSYKNYELAREKHVHIQSPIGILNFTYVFECLK